MKVSSVRYSRPRNPKHSTLFSKQIMFSPAHGKHPPVGQTPTHRELGPGRDHAEASLGLARSAPPSSGAGSPEPKPWLPCHAASSSCVCLPMSSPRPVRTPICGLWATPKLEQFHHEVLY